MNINAIKVIEENSKLNQIILKVKTSIEEEFKIIIINGKVIDIFKRISFQEWLDSNCVISPFIYIKIVKHQYEYNIIKEEVIDWINFK